MNFDFKKPLLILTCVSMFIITILSANALYGQIGDSCGHEDDNGTIIDPCNQSLDCIYSTCYAKAETNCWLGDEQCGGEDHTNVMACIESKYEDPECLGRHAYPCGNQFIGPQDHKCAPDFECKENFQGWYWCVYNPPPAPIVECQTDNCNIGDYRCDPNLPSNTQTVPQGETCTFTGTVTQHGNAWINPATLTINGNNCYKEVEYYDCENKYYSVKCNEGTVTFSTDDSSYFTLNKYCESVPECTTDDDCQVIQTAFCKNDLVKGYEGRCINNKCVAEEVTLQNCNDGLYCNGQETCENSQCVSGTAIDCSSNDITGISTCNNNPDNNPLTFDYRASFTSACVEPGICETSCDTITHTCDTSCGAECEQDPDCSITECDNLDKCVDNDYHDYDDRTNDCSECACETNSCNQYTVYENDPRCTECTTDNDCNTLDNDYCSGDLIKHDEGKCVNYECEIETTTSFNCEDNNNAYCSDPKIIYEDYTCDNAQCVLSTTSSACDTTNCNAECEQDSDCNDNDETTNDYCISCSCVNEYTPYCGNGIIDYGEDCESNNLNGFTCPNFYDYIDNTVIYFTGGDISCTNCMFDFSQCILPQCADGIDNDYDGLTDYPDDTGCENYNDNDEYNSIPEPTESNSEELTVKRITIINEDMLRVGDDILLIVTLYNDGNTNLKDLKITAVAPELAMKKNTGRFDLKKNKEITKTILLENIPDLPKGCSRCAESDEYDIRITVSNDILSRVIYRPVKIKN